MDRIQGTIQSGIEGRPMRLLPDIDVVDDHLKEEVYRRRDEARAHGDHHQEQADRWRTVETACGAALDQLDVAQKARIERASRDAGAGEMAGGLRERLDSTLAR